MIDGSSSVGNGAPSFRLYSHGTARAPFPTFRISYLSILYNKLQFNKDLI